MKHTLPDYLAGKIRDPRSFGPGLKMPKFTLTDQQMDSLTTALLAQSDRAAGMPQEMIISAARTTDYHAGGDAGRLMEDLKCLSCHTTAETWRRSSREKARLCNARGWKNS
jgi:hypothetical protein